MDALRTDLYQLTMAAGYFKRGMSEQIATCEMFTRRFPQKRRYLVAMGLEPFLDYLENLTFDESDIEFMAKVPSLADAITPAFKDYLRAFRFTGEVWAMPEGTVFFPNEPLVRITAPIIEAQLVETYLLSIMNHAVTVASKAARIVHAAGDAKVVEFGTRRTHPEAALSAARAAYAVGCVATSNVEAGRRFGIPISGTAAHMWTMAHETEEAAFAAYVDCFPNASILLIDTYDTVRGAARAAKIAGERLKGVRLDSGDLDSLSRAVRKVLDEAGCRTTRIVVSGDLNEHAIAKLRAAGAPIDLYGVGTELVVPPDGPTLGGVYKLVEIRKGDRVTPIAKFSENKATFPGAHQVHRFHDRAGVAERDVVSLANEVAAPSASSLLVKVMDRGARVAPKESLDVIRDRARAEMAKLPEALLSLGEKETTAYPVTPSPRLSALVDEVRARVKGA